MKRSALLLVASLALLISLAAALAAADSETPNDPRVNPNANACYTGGSMEGKCKLDGELWIAGWYAIRLQYGLIGRDQIPDPYKWLLPPISDTNNTGDVTDEPTREFPTSPPKPPTLTPVPSPTMKPL